MAIANLLHIRVGQNMSLTKAPVTKVSVKILIAILGGYAFTSGYVAFLSIMLAKYGMKIGEALMLSAMTGLIVYLGVILWMFSTQHVLRTSIIIVSVAAIIIPTTPYLVVNF